MHRRPSALALTTTLGFALACGGGGVGSEELPIAPEPTPAEGDEVDEADVGDGEADGEAPDPGEDWIEAAIDRAIDMETMPGTSGDESEERREALRAFFRDHPEYADRSKLEELADLACSVGVEEAHERFHDPQPLTPYEVEVKKPGWKLVVAHASVHCTSDDWSWFTNEVREAVTAKGILWDYAGAEHDELVVELAGEEVARVPLRDQGYLLLQDGQLPLDVGHDMPEGVIAEASKVFGVPLGGD